VKGTCHLSMSKRDFENYAGCKRIWRPAERNSGLGGGRHEGALWQFGQTGCLNGGEAGKSKTSPAIQVQKQRLLGTEEAKSDHELIRCLVVSNGCQISPYRPFYTHSTSPVTLPSYPMWDQCSLLPPLVSSWNDDSTPFFSSL
jgi:hypothetical protein